PGPQIIINGVSLFNHGDAGVYLSSPGPSGITSFYGGVKLLGGRSNFASYLNVQAGFFKSLLYNVTVANQPKVPNEDMYLRYLSYMVGLNWKNFYVPFEINDYDWGFGFDVSAGYIWDEKWMYGY